MELNYRFERDSLKELEKLNDNITESKDLGRLKPNDRSLKRVNERKTKRDN